MRRITAARATTEESSAGGGTGVSRLRPVPAHETQHVADLVARQDHLVHPRPHDADAVTALLQRLGLRELLRVEVERVGVVGDGAQRRADEVQDTRLRREVEDDRLAYLAHRRLVRAPARTGTGTRAG